MIIAIGIHIFHTMCSMHSKLIMALARLLISLLTAFKEFLPYRYALPFNTWVGSGNCRLMSCKRKLVPGQGSNPQPSHLQSRVEQLDYDPSTSDQLILGNQ